MPESWRIASSESSAAGQATSVSSLSRRSWARPRLQPTRQAAPIASSADADATEAGYCVVRSESSASPSSGNVDRRAGSCQSAAGDRRSRRWSPAARKISEASPQRPLAQSLGARKLSAAVGTKTKGTVSRSPATQKNAPRSCQAARSARLMRHSLGAGGGSVPLGGRFYAAARPRPPQSARFFDLLDVSAAVFHAQTAGTELLGRLLDQERRLALRTGLGDRAVPERELAVRVAVAGEEDLAAPRLLLFDRSLAALRAGDAGRLHLGGLAGLADVLALRVAGAAEEGTEAAALERHRLAALLARRNFRRGLGRRRRLLGALLGVAGVAALGIVGAAEKGAVAAEAQAQR